MSGSITFKAWLISNGIKQYEIAKLLNISLQSVNNKLNKRQDFTLAQIKTLCDTYGVSADIFLA